MATLTPVRSKTVATWIALMGGSLGLHFFYLRGLGSLAGWAHWPPAVLGVYGVERMLENGQDDRLAWLLIPMLGLAISAGALAAIVHGLTPDARWADRHAQGFPERRSGWLAICGVVAALCLGATVLIATIAFSAQRYFEAQAEVPASNAR